MTTLGFDELLTTARGVAAESVLVVTGAGISLASGIPTFRGTDPGAVWANEVTQKGTRAFFKLFPHESWRMYLQRLELARAAKPNAAHAALVEWERWQTGQGGGLTVVTQNVDSLHEQAGSQALVKVHGSLHLARCSARGCAMGPPSGTIPLEDLDFSAFHASPSPETVPRCASCRSRVRPHILWFDEYYSEHLGYEIERVYDLARHSRLVIFIGTSFSVGVTESIRALALKRLTPMFSIDPSGVTPPQGIQAVTGRAEELLPVLVRSLRG